MTDRLIDIRKSVAGSLLEFTQVFYKLRTGRKFELSQPIGRESHYISIIKVLESVFRGDTKRLIINVPPRYGKTELLIHYIAWSMAHYPDSNFLYISYSHTLAKTQTQTIRDIIKLPHYKKLFEVEVKEDTSAKDDFHLNRGGSVWAAGAGGTITGKGGGIKECPRYGGCIVIDDIHKPDEVSSDTIREGINNWYYSTMQSRLNAPHTPIIFIGQRLHEHDLAAMLIDSGEWDTLIIPAIDGAGNALHPQMHDIKMLKKMQEESPYNFAAQYQQDPQPSGGGIFKSDWFIGLEYEPAILETFITADTAETNKDYNDPTVFSFWGLYRIIQDEIDTGLFGLHWLDCEQLHIEPKDLRNEFMAFYRQCMSHKVKPKIAGIEKKSTGVTLASTLKELQGLQIIDIDRTRASGSKTDRYLEIQTYASTKRITLPLYGKHTSMCIEHCKKITANNTHRHDDICDTMYDAVKLALIDEVIVRRIPKTQSNNVARIVTSKFNRIQQIKDGLYGGGSRKVF